jgi:hypothetical protein
MYTPAIAPRLCFLKEEQDGNMKSKILVKT